MLLWKWNILIELQDNVENIYKHAKNLYLPKVKKTRIFTIGIAC